MPRLTTTRDIDNDDSIFGVHVNPSLDSRAHSSDPHRVAKFEQHLELRGALERAQAAAKPPRSSAVRRGGRRRFVMNQ